MVKNRGGSKYDHHGSQTPQFTQEREEFLRAITVIWDHYRSSAKSGRKLRVSQEEKLLRLVELKKHSSNGDYFVPQATTTII
jgi:hypothetical protein